MKTNLDDFFQKTTKDAHQAFDSASATAGTTLNNIAELPFVKPLTKMLGADWLFGEMNLEKIYTKVNHIKQQYPQDDNQALARRVVMAKAIEAGKLGVLANLLPPFALFLFGIELVVIARLLAEMVYEVAYVYGLDLKDPKRRGEVLSLFLLSLGGDSVKTALSIFEIIPGFGPIIGGSTNLILLYALGLTATNFYQSKIASIDP